MPKYLHTRRRKGKRKKRGEAEKERERGAVLCSICGRICLVGPALAHFGIVIALGQQFQIKVMNRKRSANDLQPQIKRQHNRRSFLERKMKQYIRKYVS